ncbi:MAG: P-II family nitrogen regulator [Methanophagales archaeon]|nr:P-II family nitrogen regulator [Methanophagales archaeon]
MLSESRFQLIVVVVETGRASAIMEAARAAGAEGGTILHGRGVGIHEHSKFFGIPIEPEKEILMILIEKTHTEVVLEAVVMAGELNEPGKGIAFVLDVSEVEGIVHMGTIVSSFRE